MWNGGERSGTVRDDEGLWCHDGGLSVTMGHDDVKMVTGQNHNFYCIVNLIFTQNYILLKNKQCLQIL